MLKNFLRTAYRNILKYKAYAIINFIGLTAGLALSLLIMVYVRSEVSFDTFHKNIDRLYRMKYAVANGLQLAATPPPIAPLLKDYFPEVEETARIYGRNVSITRPGLPEAFEESDVLFADSTITKLFTFQFVKGNPRRALHDKFTVIINEEMSRKYFGDADPIGESLTFAGIHQFKVIAVVRNFPEQSHIRFNMLVPYDNMFDMESDRTAKVLRENLSINFVISHSYTYLLLKPGADPSHIDARMNDFLKKYAQPRLLVGQVFSLMPVSKIHLESELLMEPSSPNSWANIYIFIGVGLLTLIIACINYINLSTAQSFARVKEIGIRKILGSMRYQLIGQFMSESLLFCTISVAFAYVAFYFLLPQLNELTNQHLVFKEVIDLKLILFSLSLLVLITVMAGIYPSYFVTKFESISALKGGTRLGNDQFLRKSLVVFQLAIACMLVSGSILIVRQLDYLDSRPLGFQKEQIITVPLYSQNLNGVFNETDSTHRSRIEAFRNSVESLSGVSQTTLSSGPPGLGVTFRGTIPDGFTQEDNLFVANMSIDYDFISAFGMEVASGRSFARDFGTDQQEGFIINETAVKEFKWDNPENAIGKVIDREGKKGKVVGVVRDFNFSSMATPITALILELDPDQFSSLSVKFTDASGERIIKQLESDWNRIFPEKAFEFSHLDQTLERQYTDYQRFGAIIQSFTGIAILISCLGVYGLVLFTVQRKVKEIGVRKVLGADVRSILYIIYRDFALLLFVGFIIAIPASYYFMNQWLSNFTYRTDIGVVTFVASLGLVFTIVSITISYQAVRAARANPVRSLRSE